MKNITCISECEVLALATFISNEWAKCTKNTEELMLWGDVATTIGANLTLLANQRERREDCKPNNNNTEQEKD